MKGAALRKNSWINAVKIAGLALLMLAAACTVLMAALRVEEITVWYERIQAELLEFENAVASIKRRELFLAAILAVYCLKSVLPLMSTSAICLLTGAVFPVYVALPLNVLGLMFVFGLRYGFGLKFGGGNANKLIKKNETIRDLLEREGTGNPWLLFAFRLVPNFPVNAVSQIYGNMRFDFGRFLLLSVAGYAPKLVSYTFIGRHVYDPLSPSFLTPIVVISTISGLSLLSLNLIWGFVEKNIRLPRPKSRKGNIR